MNADELETMLNGVGLDRVANSDSFDIFTSQDGANLAVVRWLSPGMELELHRVGRYLFSCPHELTPMWLAHLESQISPILHANEPTVAEVITSSVGFLDVLGFSPWTVEHDLMSDELRWTHPEGWVLQIVWSQFDQQLRMALGRTDATEESVDYLLASPSLLTLLRSSDHDMTSLAIDRGTWIHQRIGEWEADVRGAMSAFHRG